MNSWLHWWKNVLGKEGAMVRKARKGKIITFNSGFLSFFVFSVISFFAFLVLN